MQTDHSHQRHFFSSVYRGFILQQTEQGWIIVNFPDWSRAGPMPQGPFETEYIARKQVDRLLETGGGI